ncbi:MAG: hypothetical protein JO235_05280 [Chroococcidiopsidaceae cyanobacterium CP_BM_RX_35]|nr:hypothetical protein [Chroococcidiopsidaceae cyanobacterium CP_BM_RX_35]
MIRKYLCQRLVWLEAQNDVHYGKQYVGVAVSDGVQAAAQGKFKQAWKHWFNRKNLVSLKAVWEEAPWLQRL